MPDKSNRLPQTMSERRARHEEIFLLAGCTICGRRLVENDQPRAGAVLLTDANEPDLVRQPYCGLCLVERLV